MLKVFHLYVCGSSPSEPLLMKVTPVLFCGVSMVCWVPMVLPFLGPVKKRCLHLLLSLSSSPPPHPRGAFLFRCQIVAVRGVQVAPGDRHAEAFKVA